MKKVRLFKLVFVLGLILTVPTQAEIIRDGNVIIYRWMHESPTGEFIQLEFGVNYCRGIDYMQKEYSRKSHRYSKKAAISYFLF